MKFLIEDDRSGHHIKCHVYTKSPVWKVWEKWTYLHTAMCHGDAADFCDIYADAHCKPLRHPNPEFKWDTYESRDVV